MLKRCNILYRIAAFSFLLASSCSNPPEEIPENGERNRETVRPKRDSLSLITTPADTIPSDFPEAMNADVAAFVEYVKQNEMKGDTARLKQLGHKYGVEKSEVVFLEGYPFYVYDLKAEVAAGISDTLTSRRSREAVIKTNCSYKYFFSGGKNKPDATLSVFRYENPETATTAFSYFKELLANENDCGIPEMYALKKNYIYGLECRSSGYSYLISNVAKEFRIIFTGSEKKKQPQLVNHWH